MPTSQGRSSVGVASMGGLPSGRSVPARTSTVRVPRPSRTRGRPPSRTVDAATLQRLHQRRIPLGGRHHDDHLGVGAGRRRRPARPVRSGCLSMTPVGSSGHPGATSRPQTMTMPGPCHSSSRRAMSRQAARELSVGSGGRRRSPMTSTLRPSATGRRAVRADPQWPARFPPPCRRRVPFLVHGVTFEASDSSAIRRIPRSRGRGETLRLVLRARDQARGRPDQLDVARRGRARRTPAGRP